MLRKWGPLLIATLLAIGLAILAATPPAPKSLETSPHQFSSARAMKDVHIVAAQPHPTGSEENAKVRTYLIRRLEELGAQVEVQQSLLGERALARLNKWSSESKTEQAIFNIIGVRPGTQRSKPAILLMAHHDTVWGSPGAADDTVGIAAILEIMRAVNEAGKQERDLVVLFTDGEELGLSGARSFFKDNPLATEIGAVINFEARGGGGTANLFQTSAQNGAAVQLFAQSVKQPSASSLATFVYNILPNDTDLTPALENDYTAYNIANLGRAKYYHSPKINAQALDEGTLQHMGSQGLDLTRALLSASDLPAKRPDAVFFDFFGFFTVIYSPFWGWVFLGLATLCYAATVNSKPRRKGVILGCVKMLGFLFIGAILLYMLNRLSGRGPSSDYYDRLAAIPRLEVMALCLCLVMFFTIFGKKILSEGERVGAAIPILILSVLGQAFAPTATYFISLPFLLCGIVSVLMSRWPDAKATIIISVLFAALIGGYMLNLGHLLMLGVGPDILSVAILPAAIFVLALLPLYKGLSTRVVNYVVMAGVMLSGLLALWIRFDPVASTVPLY